MIRPLLIGDRWTSDTGGTLVSTNPADGSVNAEVAAAGAAEVDQAAQTASRAVRDSGWAQRKPHERAAILYRIADAFLARHEELAQLQMTDNGKPVGECRGLVASAASTIRYFGAVCETLEESITPSRGDFLTFDVYEPMGVVAAITAWNSPIATEWQKVAPALAAGNAVLLKPAEQTPLLALETAKIALEAGLPPGILNVLPGDGPVAGASIVAHPLVRKVSFTGGNEAGKAIARVAAEKLMPVTLELGGKSPNIVFADADREHALAGAIFGIFSSCGQACIAGSRLFVQRSIYEEFVEELCRRTRALRVGVPSDPATQVGPLIDAGHRGHVESYIALAASEGGRVIEGGVRPDGVPEGGAYLRPTVIDGLTNASRTAREEIFGPVVVLLPFEDEDDVVAQANDTVYGLACGIWTEDYRRAWRVARRIDAGNVWINTYKQFTPTLPFGGMKESGVGREKGRQAVRSFMEQKGIFLGLNEEPLPYARPERS